MLGPHERGPTHPSHRIGRRVFSGRRRLSQSSAKGDGTVVGWGYNYYGQASPPSGLTGVKAIAAGQHHSLALKSDGTVVAWGWNDSGQASPPSGLTDVQAIDAGDYHSLALKTDGTIVGWGDDEEGQGNPPPGSPGLLPPLLSAAFTISPLYRPCVAPRTSAGSHGRGSRM